jgi:hypothetical protein
MTSQQLADQLLAQWQLLWPLPPAERLRVIEETRLDMEYAEQLHAVEQEMAQ